MSVTPYSRSCSSISKSINGMFLKSDSANNALGKLGFVVFDLDMCLFVMLYMATNKAKEAYHDKYKYRSPYL